MSEIRLVFVRLFVRSSVRAAVRKHVCFFYNHRQLHTNLFPFISDPGKVTITYLHYVHRREMVRVI